jgi:Phage integrase family
MLSSTWVDYLMDVWVCQVYNSHTFASRLVAAGVSLVDVSKLLGHAQITTTMRYAHITSDSQRKAVEALCNEKWTPNGHQEQEPNLTEKNAVLYLEDSA